MNIVSKSKFRLIKWIPLSKHCKNMEAILVKKVNNK